jgi:hypothetical protein
MKKMETAAATSGLNQISNTRQSTKIPRYQSGTHVRYLSYLSNADLTKFSRRWRRRAEHN